MATVQIYDQSADASYTVNITLNKAVVTGQDDGAEGFYIVMSTSARTPAGGAIANVILDDDDIDSAISLEIRAGIVILLTEIQGGLHSSSSSSVSSSSQSMSESSNTVSSSSTSSVATKSSSSTSSVTSQSSVATFSSSSSTSSVATFSSSSESTSSQSSSVGTYSSSSSSSISPA